MHHARRPRLQDGRRAWPAGSVVAARSTRAAAQPIVPKYLLGPAGAVLRVDGHSGPGSSATISGWACDPEWPGATVARADLRGAPRESGQHADRRGARRSGARRCRWRARCAACDGPSRSLRAPRVLVHAAPTKRATSSSTRSTRRTADGPPAPPTLIRNGIVPVPRCAHSEHVAGEALDASCSTCATNVCGRRTRRAARLPGPTTVRRAADECAPAEQLVAGQQPRRTRRSPAVGSKRRLTAATCSIRRSNRAGCSSTAPPCSTGSRRRRGRGKGSITLSAGQRYHLRWDRFQAEPPGGSPGPGLTWQPPGAGGQERHPADGALPADGGGRTAA